METPKYLINILVVLFAMVFCTSCVATPTSIPTPPSAVPEQTPDPNSVPFQQLKNLEFQNFAGAIAGTIPPEMSSYRYDPALALGAMFERVLKGSATENTCDSTNANDFELRRIVSLATLPECEPQRSEPNQKFEERIVKGGANAKINHLVGEAGLEAEYAFEFLVSNPAAASYPGNQVCVDTVKLTQFPPSPRTCEIYFVNGATLSQITYRQYAKVDVNAKYNAIVTVEGTAYGSSSHMQALLVLTADFISLGNWFARDANGFVIKPTESEAEAVMEEVKSLSPSEFFEVTALSETDKALLADLSMENLLMDPSTNP